MKSDVLLISAIVGVVNYLFRYLPLHFGRASTGATKQRRAALLLDSIGIASICSLLIVSSMPDIIRDHQKLIPTLIGFIILAGVFYRTKSIILSTLTSAVGYGLVFKFLL